MEHETFEDSAAAAFMNEHFINIKVDREERPDVDGVYMTAVQLMTQRGGWPLNAVCMPDGRPVYGGTYFPRERWLQALQSVLDTRAQDPERVEAYATQLTAGVQQAELVNVPPLEGSKAWGTSDAFGRRMRNCWMTALPNGKTTGIRNGAATTAHPSSPFPPTSISSCIMEPCAKTASTGPRPEHLAQDGTRRHTRSHRRRIRAL